MSHVFVLDTNKKPLAPVHPGQARRLLTQGKAAVFKCFPFTIILKEERPNQQVQPGVTTPRILRCLSGDFAGGGMRFSVFAT